MEVPPASRGRARVWPGRPVSWGSWDSWRAAALGCAEPPTQVQGLPGAPSRENTAGAAGPVCSSWDLRSRGGRSGPRCGKWGPCAGFCVGYATLCALGDGQQQALGGGWGAVQRSLSPALCLGHAHEVTAPWPRGVFPQARSLPCGPGPLPGVAWTRAVGPRWPGRRARSGPRPRPRGGAAWPEAPRAAQSLGAGH